MQTRIIQLMGLNIQTRMLLIDVDHLWLRFSCDEAAVKEGFSVRHITDEMELRCIYEKEIRDFPKQKILLILDSNDIYVPSDIRASVFIQRLTYNTLFPMLNADAIRELPGLDYFRLFAYAERIYSYLDYSATKQVCLYALPQDSNYAEQVLSEAENIARTAQSHRDWDIVAQKFGQAALYEHSAGNLNDFKLKRENIENYFKAWIMLKYGSLSGSVDKNRPVLLSKAADFVRKASSKVCLLVMDGMSFENFFKIKDKLIAEPFEFQISSSFSFFPSVTSVARQSIFSGKLPRENAKPFSLDNEEKQWREFWIKNGLKSNEIGFFKSDEPDYDPKIKALGIVVNICDDLMHAELQGLKGLEQGLDNWLDTGKLAKLLSKLLDDGYTIFMTSDHGNTSAIAEGRFTKPGLLAEPASRRAVIYQGFADATEMSKFNTFRYEGHYLPEGYNAYLFETDACYGDKGKEYITHGGMTIEEVVVPFVRIGAYHG